MIGSGDRWVACGQGHRHWGAYGAAGLLIRHGGAVLLQRRAWWAHHGGTWGIPGGARHRGEEPYAAAVREAVEECGPLPPLVLCQIVADDHGGWAYHTCVVDAAQRFTPVDSAESAGHDWFTLGEVAGLSLHPGLAALIHDGTGTVHVF